MGEVKCQKEQERIERMQPKAGEWLSRLRRSAEITAAELAEQVGVDADLIAAIETGRTPVPAALYKDLARIFGVASRDFAKACLMYSNPSAFEAIFGDLPEKLREAA
jgi:transcriptional regulator with XRE-family HTH domain